MSLLLDSNLISTRDASALSGYHSDYLARLCREEKIVGSRIGRSWVLDRASLDAFIRDQELAKKEHAVALTRQREQEYREAQKVHETIAVVEAEQASETPVEAPEVVSVPVTTPVSAPERSYVPIPSPYAELHPIRNSAVAALIAVVSVGSGLVAAEARIVEHVARISVENVAIASDIGYEALASAATATLAFETELGRSIISGVDTLATLTRAERQSDTAASIRFAYDAGALLHAPTLQTIPEALYGAQLSIGTTLIGTSDAILAAHHTGTNAWVEGSDIVPRRVIAAIYGVGDEFQRVALLAPHAAATTADTAIVALAGETRTVASNAVDAISSSRDVFARAFNTRLVEPRATLAAVPHEDTLGPARALALFTYETLNSFFDATSRTLAMLFAPLAPNVAYAPELTAPGTGTTSVSRQVVEVSRVVNEITNVTYSSPITYVYGGVTMEYVRAAIENLRDDVADADYGSGDGGLADITGSSIEELSDVGTMAKTWGDLLFWDGTEWSNLATSSLGITGSGIPGGAPGYVQYNVGGNFGGDAAFTFDAAADRLSFTYGSTTAFSTGFLNATSAVIDTLSSTVATVTSLIATNATTTNATSTNLTALNSFALGADRITDLTGSGLTVTAGALAVDDVTPAMLQAADFGDFTCNGTSCSFDADTVSDSELDYGTVTLTDFTNDAGFITGIGAFSIEDLSDVAAMTESYGNLLSWNGSAWTNIATSTLNIALSNTTGILPISRGGTGTSTVPTYGQLLVGDGLGGYALLATSSLGISGSGGTPGGLTGQVQFNSAGTFAGDTGFTYDAAADRLTVTYASSTAFSSIYASSTNVFAGNLTVGSLTGILKATGGVVSAATAGTDYENPLTFAYPLTRSVNTVSLAFGTTTTNTWVHQIFSSLVATNASSTNATTSQLAVTSLPSQLLRTDGTGRLAGTTIGTGLTFDGTTLSATGGGGTGNVSTSSSETAGQVPYWTTTAGSPARLGSVATTTFAVSGPFNVSGSLGSLIGGTNATISYYGLATTSNISQGQVLYGTSASGVASVATSTPALSTAFSYSGTLGSFVGGTSGTLSLANNGVALTNLAQIAANTVLANPTGAIGNVQAIATSTFFGTGTGGYVLAWNNGAPTWVGTSSIQNGVAAIGPAGQTQTGTVLIATSTSGTDITVTATGGTITFNIPSASASARGFLTSTDWNTFNNKISSTSLSGGTGISYDSGSGVITNTGVTSLSGTTNQITASAATGAVTLSLPGLVAFPNAYTATYGTTTYASSTALSATYASSTNLFAGNFTLGTLNGPLQANNGVVSATTTIGAIYGGTGQSSYAVGDLLYADSATSLARLPVSTNGLVLKLVGGLPSWQPDLTTGGGGGAGAWSTTTDSLAIYPSDTSDVVIIGASATSTTGSIFEVAGRSYFSNTLSIGTTSGSSLFRLAVQGNGLFSGNLSTANLTATGTVSTANLTATAATTTYLGINNETFTDLTGTGLQNVGGALTINATGDWTGTFDGQEGSYYLNRANHTGTQLASTISDFDGAVNTYIAGSTTIPKTYSANTFTGAQVFSGGVTIGTLNGPLQANNGVVSATTSVGVLYGGTGLTTAPTYGQILVGNALGGYTLTATSSLGLVTNAITAIGPAGQTQNGPTVTFATSSAAFNGLTASTTITATGNTITFSNTLAGLLGVAGGGTGSTTLGGILTGNGTGQVTSATVSAPLSFSGNTLSISQANGSTNGYLSSTDWNTFNNKISSTSLSGASVISYTSGTGVITTIGGTFGAGNYVFPSALTVQGASSFQNASTTNLSANTLAVGGTGTTSVSATGALTTPSLTIGTLNGPLQANNGAVSATTSIGVLYGGTGLTTAPTYGQILVGNSSGGYTLTATSSLGLVTSAVTAIGPAGQTQTGPTVTLATSSTAFNGLTASTTITGTGNVITFSNTLAGVLGVAGGGTGSTTLGGILTGNGTGQVTSATVSGPLSFSGNTLSISQANGSTNGYLSSTDWNTFNNKISSTSLSGGTGISYDSGTGVITNTGVTSLSGTTNQITASAATGAVTLSLPGLVAFPNAYTATYGTTTYASSTALSTVYASSTNAFFGNLSVGALTGPLQAINGTVSASSTLSVAYGGTGWNSIQANAVLYGNGAGRLATTSAGTNGQVLALVNGVPTWVATSSINNGVSSIQQSFGAAQTGAITLATSSDTNVLLSITNSGGTFTFAPSWTGQLAVARGGTGAGSFTSGQLVYGAGTGALQSVATSTFAVSGPFTTSGTLGSLVGGTNATVTYYGLATTSAISQGQVLYATGAAGVASVATSTPTLSAAFSYSGTLGSFVGGVNGTLSLATNGVALNNLAQIAANTVLANPTGATGNVQAIATSTFFGTGTGGQVLTWNNGVPQWVATTTYANGTGISTSFANGQLTITNTGVTSLSGTTNQITASAGTGAVTLSLPSLVAFPNAYTATYGTTTYASSTALSSVYASSTNVFAGNLSIGALTGILKATAGVVSTAVAGTDYVAGGAGAATTTLSFSGPFTTSATPVVFGSSPITTTYYGLATTSAISQGQVLYGTSASGVASVATSSVSAGTGIGFTGTPGALVGGTALTITNTGVTSLSGTTNQITASAGTGAVTLSIPSLFSIQQASTTMLSSNGPFFVGTTSTTTIWGNATSTFSGGINLTNGGCYAIGGTCIGALGASGTVNNGTTGQIPYYAANGNILTATSSIFIAASSDVGIGTNAPTNYGAGYRTLAIDGAASGVLDVMSNGTLSGTLYNDGSTFRVGNRNPSAFELITDNTPRLTISGGGDVTINGGSLTIGTLSGLLKATNGLVSAATAGTDYIAGGAGAATSSVSCAGTASCTSFVAFSATPITITGTGLSAYDAWTHPAAGQSATTSLMLFNGNASTTQLSATRAYFGGTATTTITAAGFVGVGSSTPWAQLSINPTSANGSAPSFVIGSSTATGFVVTNAGYVGIGTAAPTDKLYIDNGNMLINQGTINLLNPSGNAGRVSFNGGNDTSRFYLGTSHEQNYFELVDSADTHIFTVEGGAGVDGGLLHFDASENLGVATTSPYARLSVWGKSTGKIFEAITSASSSALSVSATGFGTTTLSGLTVSGSATSTSNVGFNITSGCYAVNGTCISGGGSGLSSYDAWTHASIYQSATTSMMGFGTTTPRWALQVASSTAPQLTLSDATGGHWSFRSINGNLYIATSSATTFATTSTTALTINTVGNIGIGSSSPWGQLSINANGGVTGSNPLFAIGSSTSNLLVVDYAGRMGLGTTSPYAKLSVVGETVSTFFTATSTSATSTFAGGLNVGSGALTHDFTSGVTSIGNLAIGAMTFDTNSGVISWVDMPVTSTASAGTVQSYSAQLDGTSVLTVYAVSDGAGGIASTSVGISSSTPWGMFSVEQTNSTTSPVFVVGDQGTSTPHLYIGANGRVGVGTTSPWARTSLNAPAGEAAFAIGSSTRNLFYVTSLGTTTIGRGLDIIGAVATSSSNVGWNITTGCYAVNNTCLSSGLSSYDAWTHASIYQSATTSMMGFGTTTPRWALQVASSTAPQLALSDGSLTSNHWTFRNAGGGLFIGTSSPLTFATTSISALTINASGNLGIGTTSPSSRLTVAGSGFFEGSNNYINFATTTGANGYGFRDNGGVMEFKNMGGTWQGVTTATTGPSFSVHKNSSDQTVTAGVDTLLTWATEEYDTNNNFNLGTGRFQPTVPGKYVIYLQVRTTNGSSAVASIYKNGSLYKLGIVSSALIANVTAVVDMNGSTDYVDAYVTNTGGTTISGNITQTYFSGIMVAPLNNNVATNLNLQYDGTQTTQVDQTKFFGLGTSTPWARLSINPLATDLTAPAFVIGSSTATNLLVTNAGRVGIGTTSPYASGLSINTVAGADSFAVGSSTGTYLRVTSMGTTSALRLDVTGTATSSFGNGINLTSGCYAVNGTCVGGSAAVGGTGAVQFANGSSLSGVTSFFFDSARTALGVGTSTPHWSLSAASSTGPQLGLSDGSLTSNHWTFRNAGGLLYIGTTSPSTFATTSISALTINANGNLGIGTSSPSSRLTVAGSGFFEGSNNYINFATTTGVNGYGFRDNGGIMEYKNMGGSWQGVSTATTGPSFSVHRNGTNQTVTGGATTKVNFTHELFDTNNNFDNATNYRFTPTVAGKYVISGSVYCGSETKCEAILVKNGSAYAGGTYVEGASGNSVSQVSTVVDMNGTTDYLELHVYTSVSTTLLGSSLYTYFSGIMVAPVNNNVVANLNLQYDGTQTTQIDQTKFFGIGTSTPWAQFAINPLASNGSAPSFVIGSSTATHLIVTNAGNLGLGTTTPFWKLNIADATKSQLTLSDGSATQNPWSFRSINGNLYIATSSPSTLATSTIAALTINSNGTVLVGNGLGKLTIGTLDPVYTVNGTAYATYMAGMIGVKEETTGNAVIDTPMTADDGSTGYVTVLDFDELEAGSDLWLFSQTTHIRKNIDKLVVLLSAENGGKVWYEIDKAERKVYLLADRPTRVSYRMTAPRFDSETWTNYNHDGVTGFRPPSDDLTVYFTDNHELSFGNANLVSGTSTLATLLEEYDEEGEAELKPWTAALFEASEGLKTAMDDLSDQVIEVMHGAQYFADGIFKRIFAQEVYTDKICVTDAEGETCLTRAQLQQLLSGAAASGGGGNGGGSGGDTGGGDTGGDTGGGDTGGDTGEGDTGGDEGGGDAGDGSEGDTGGGGTGGDEGGGDTGGDTGGGDTGGDGGGDSGGDTGGGDAGGGDSGGDAGGGAP